MITCKNVLTYTVKSPVKIHVYPPESDDSTLFILREPLVWIVCSLCRLWSFRISGHFQNCRYIFTSIENEIFKSFDVFIDFHRCGKYTGSLVNETALYRSSIITVDCIYPWAPDVKTCSNWRRNVEANQPCKFRWFVGWFSKSPQSRNLQIHGKFSRTERTNLNKLSCQVGKPQGPVV